MEGFLTFLTLNACGGVRDKNKTKYLPLKSVFLFNKRQKEKKSSSSVLLYKLSQAISYPLI